MKIGVGKNSRYKELVIDLTYFITANYSVASIAFKANTTHGSGRSC